MKNHVMISKAYNAFRAVAINEGRQRRAAEENGDMKRVWDKYVKMNLPRRAEGLF